MSVRSVMPASVPLVEGVRHRPVPRNRCVVGILSLCVPLICQADSDGYYCVSIGYFAYESRSFHSDGAHRLLIVPLNKSVGIGPRIAVELPDFQLHGMRCTPTAITIFSFDTAYEVDLSDPAAPRYTGDAKPPDIVALREGFAARRFGDTPELALNVGRNTPGEFVLRVSFEGEAFPGGIEYTTVAKIVRLTGSNALLDSRVIFAETLIETID